MKVKIVWCVFVITLFLLLLFQLMFLYNTYILKQEAVQEILNSEFVVSLEKEVSERFLEASKLIEKAPKEYEELAYTFNYNNNNRITEQGLMSVEFQNQQSFLDYIDFPFELAAFGGIYKDQLLKRKMSLDCNLIYRDSIKIIDSIGHVANPNFKTDNVYITDGKFVQAHLFIPIPFVFKEMIGLLIVSILMLFLIVVCLIYEMRVIITQRRLTRLRDDFSHALVHDMKTPLGTIYMAVDQWGKGVLDKSPELRSKFADTAIAQVLNLQALVDKILTIAYLEQNKLTLEPKIMDLSKMVQGLVDKFSIQAKKPVKFTIDINMENTHIVADPTYLTNAVSNLIDNAIKYSGDSVEIDINCHSDNSKLFIEVSDNGFGISDKDREKIFEKFERGAAIKRKGAKGFGLGLNYVRRVMNAHGGTVSLSSIEGQGAKFVLYMPLKVSFI